MKTIDISTPLHKNKITVVDNEDYEYLSMFKWTCEERKNGRFYVMRSAIKNKVSKTVRIHNVIMGVSSRSRQIDHINGDGLDNRKQNLRICSGTQNQMNREVRPTKLSKYKGVIKQKCGTFTARIAVSKKRICLGTYPTEILAARAYDTEARRAFGEYARLNFPDISEPVLPTIKRRGPYKKSLVQEIDQYMVIGG